MRESLRKSADLVATHGDPVLPHQNFWRFETTCSKRTLKMEEPSSRFDGRDLCFHQKAQGEHVSDYREVRRSLLACLLDRKGQLDLLAHVSELANVCLHHSVGTSLVPCDQFDMSLTNRGSKLTFLGLVQYFCSSLHG